MSEFVALVQLAEAPGQLRGLGVGRGVVVDRLFDAELGQPRDRMVDVALLEERDQLFAHARTGEVVDVAL